MMVKKGLVALGVGLAAMFCVPDFGPCGPSTLTGMILFVGGLLSLLVGFGMAGVGLIITLVRRIRENDKLNQRPS
jgi:hypothetical protein